jgi:hypothetical protein
MKYISIAAMLLYASLFATAAETKSVTNRDGNCTVTVPANWIIQQNVGIAQSTDKKVAVVVSSPSQGLSSLAEVEQLAPTLYPDDKVTKKSGSEFEMEGKNTADKPNVYRAIPAGAKVCIAEITYERGSIDDARAIIETLKAK